MNMLIAASIVVLLLTIVLSVWRVQSTVLMMSILVGWVLQRTLGDSSEFALAAVMRSGPTYELSQAGLLLLPVVLTLLLMRRSLPRPLVLVQALPLLLAVASLGILLLHSLPDTLANQLYNAPGGIKFQRAEDLVITAGAIMNLLLAWRMYRLHESGGHKKH
ncbi:hypothetical protein CR970_00240 [Candidatus Saccharibacteria bacterium]|nr:MAG: hypothetical protein CR970_00240 [Candidatus Saccharibacteria bacterium]